MNEAKIWSLVWAKSRARYLVRPEYRTWVL
jgi:hypothetical protein